MGMLPFILGLVSAALAIVFAVLYSAFSHVTPKELKRRARSGDEIAALLYRSVSYGLSAKLVLGGLAALCAYGAVVLLVRALDAWLAIPVLIVIGRARWLCGWQSTYRPDLHGCSNGCNPFSAE